MPGHNFDIPTMTLTFGDASVSINHPLCTAGRSAYWLESRVLPRNLFALHAGQVIIIERLRAPPKSWATSTTHPL
jgi:hypothetical protein